MLEYSETVEDVKVVKEDIQLLKTRIKDLGSELESVKKGQSEPLSVIDQR